MLKCRECNFTTPHFLGDHLLEAHGLTVDEYLTKHPGVETASQELLDTVTDSTVSFSRHSVSMLQVAQTRQNRVVYLRPLQK